MRKLDHSDRALVKLIHDLGISREAIEALGKFIPRLGVLAPYVGEFLPREVSRRMLEEAEEGEETGRDGGD